jgi:hypothetical protein
VQASTGNSSTTSQAHRLLEYVTEGTVPSTYRPGPAADGYEADRCRGGARGCRRAPRRTAVSPRCPAVTRIDNACGWPRSAGAACWSSPRGRPSPWSAGSTPHATGSFWRSLSWVRRRSAGAPGDRGFDADIPADEPGRVGAPAVGSGCAARCHRAASAGPGHRRSATARSTPARRAGAPREADAVDALSSAPPTGDLAGTSMSTKTLKPWASVTSREMTSDATGSGVAGRPLLICGLVGGRCGASSGAGALLLWDARNAG